MVKESINQRFRKPVERKAQDHISNSTQLIDQSYHLRYKSITNYLANMPGSSTFSLDHHHHPPHSAISEQLCYVHCNFCDTVLAVSVPTTSLFKTVTVRCGHCTNLLSVNMRALLLPPANQLHFNHPLCSNSYSNHPEEMPMSSPPNFLVGDQSGHEDVGSIVVKKGNEEPHRPQVVNRPPEKRQRVPSAYNRFIKEEIQRIKAGNPDISHREAFSAAAKNWAHFPHIHFGMASNQKMKKMNGVCQQEGANLIVKDGLHSATDMGVTPY